MHINQVKLEIARIVSHQHTCWALRKDNPKECTCGHDQIVDKLNQLFLDVLKQRR